LGDVGSRLEIQYLGGRLRLGPGGGGDTEDRCGGQRGADVQESASRDVRPPLIRHAALSLCRGEVWLAAPQNLIAGLGLSSNWGILGRPWPSRKRIPRS